jgi:hypothetical protein
VSETGRQDTAIATATASPARPFSAPNAGADYLATEAHYLSLAARVADAVRRGCRFLLVTGDPSPDPLMLSSALTSAAAGQFAALRIVCGPEFTPEQLLRAVRGVPSGAGGLTPEQLRLVPSASPLFVFDVADILSDAQFEGIYEILAPRGRPTVASVLLGTPDFLTRLERLKPRIFNDGLAVRFSFRELGREETEQFIRRQLRSGEEAGAFTAEAIGAIADFSGGDPALVNRLARIMLDNPDWSGSPQEKKPAGIVAEQQSKALLRHGRPAWATSAGILMCVVAAALVCGELGEIRLPQIAHETPAPAGAIASPTPVKVPRPLELPAASAEMISAAQAEQEFPTAGDMPAAPEPLKSANATEPEPSTTPIPPAPEPRLATEQTAALVARGDALLRMRDIASARLYYERAAEAGDGRAALRLGETFDPAFLGRAGIRGTQADRQQAVSWYRRSHDLGDPDAARMLEKMEPR